MALTDLIASSGARNFETMRKGWLPTAQETNTRRLQELGIQQREQALEQAPIARKRKTARFDAEQKRNDQVTKAFEQKYKRADTKEKIDTEKQNLSEVERLVGGAVQSYGKGKKTNFSNVLTVLESNMDRLLEVSDDKDDKVLKKIVSGEMSEKDSMAALNNVMAVMPQAQKSLRAQALALTTKGMGTEFERSMLRKRLGLSFLPDENDRVDKLSGKSKAKRFGETMRYKTEKDLDTATVKMYDDSKKELKYITDYNNSLGQIQQSIDAGNDPFLDKLLTSQMMTLNKTNVRAKAMWDVYDEPMGNLYARTTDRIYRMIGGEREPEQLKLLSSSIKKLRAASQPMLQSLRAQKRAFARDKGLDPFKVIPPSSAQDIIDSRVVDDEEKYRLFDAYPQFQDEIDGL